MFYFIFNEFKKSTFQLCPNFFVLFLIINKTYKIGDTNKGGHPHSTIHVDSGSSSSSSSDTVVELLALRRRHIVLQRQYLRVPVGGD